MWDAEMPGGIMSENIVFLLEEAVDELDKIDERNLERPLKDALKVASFGINGILDEYVGVHNKFVKQTDSIFSVSRKIRYDELSNGLLEPLKKLDRYQKIIDRLEPKIAQNGSVIQKSFFDLFQKYVAALANVVSIFAEILNSLHAQAENLERLEYGSYSLRMDQYESAREEYLAIGERLSFEFNRLINS